MTNFKTNTAFYLVVTAGLWAISGALVALKVITFDQFLASLPVVGAAAYGLYQKFTKEDAINELEISTTRIYHLEDDVEELTLACRKARHELKKADAESMILGSKLAALIEKEASNNITVKDAPKTKATPKATKAKATNAKSKK